MVPQKPALCLQRNVGPEKGKLSADLFRWGEPRVKPRLERKLVSTSGCKLPT